MKKNHLARKLSLQSITVRALDHVAGALPAPTPHSTGGGCPSSQAAHCTLNNDCTWLVTYDRQSCW